MSDCSVMRVGLRALLPECGARVVAELTNAGRLADAVRAGSAHLVILVPVDGGMAGLFSALDSLPAGCPALVLLPTPGFRIQASAVRSRFDVVCLPLNLAFQDLHQGVRQALRQEGSRLSVEERCTGQNGILTTREQEVLRELAQGKCNRAIAQSLWVTEDTVKSHLQRIYRKLGVGTRAEAVSLYYRATGQSLPQVVG